MPKGQRKVSGTFSLGFLDDGRMSGKPTFHFLKSVLAHPMRRKQGLSPMGDRTPQDYETSIENGYVTVEGDILVGTVPNVPDGVAFALAESGCRVMTMEGPSDDDGGTGRRQRRDLGTTTEGPRDDNGGAERWQMMDGYRRPHPHSLPSSPQAAIPDLPFGVKIIYSCQME